MKTKYQAIEDNGGGLMLAVFYGDVITYMHDDYEYNVGQLSRDIENLKAGDNPLLDWEGNVEDPQAAYDNVTSYEYGWEIVADQDGIYPDKMGRAAKIEFGIIDEI